MVLNINYCGNSTRYIIMIVSILALSFVLANSLALNFTVICMYKPDNNSIGLLSNATIIEPQLLYSVSQQSMLFSATALGNILGSLPLTLFINRLGVRRTFTLYGFISGIATLAIPFLVPLGFIPIFVMRILEGFGVSICFTSLGAIVSSWSTLKGSGTYIALLSCHFQIGAIIAMGLGGEFCSNSYGWEIVYYILGACTVLSFALFFVFYRDAPSLHKNVSDKELNRISRGKIQITKEQNKIPYRAIFTDPAVIGIIISCFGACLGIQTIFQYGPIYLNKVLGFDAKKTGVAAALPFFLAIFIKFIVGPFSDMFTFFSEKGKIIFFNSLSQIPMCVCFLLLAILPSNMLWLIQIAYSLVNAFAGLGAVGVSKSIAMISLHHAHFIMTVGSFTNSIVILLLPLFISSIAPDNAPHQWAIIFYALAIFIFCTLMCFNFTASAEPREWALIYTSSKVEDSTLDFPGKDRRYSEPSGFIARL